MDVRSLGLELSSKLSDDVDRLHPTPRPVAADGAAAAPSSLSVPHNGGKGKVMTEQLVSAAEIVHWAGTHIPPSEWQPGVPFHLQPGLHIIAPTEAREQQPQRDEPVQQQLQRSDEPERQDEDETMAEIVK